MPTIFITHAHADNVFVNKITKRLEEYGYTIWVDLNDITPGASIPGKIAEVFNEIDYQLIVISNASVDSKWVNKEINIGINYEINNQKPLIIGLKIDNVKIPVMLSEKLYVNFINFEIGWQELNRKLPDISKKIPLNVNKEIYDFLDYCRYIRNVQPSTLDTYEYNLMKLGEYFEQKGLGKLGIDFDWNKVKEKHLKGYENHLTTRTKLSSSSIHQQISTFRNFFRFLKSEEVVLNNPMEKIPLPKRININKELIDYNDFNEVLNSIPLSKIEYRAVLEVMFSTGGKISEISKIFPADLDIKNRIIEIRKIQNGVKRVAFLNQRAIKVLEYYIENRRPDLLKIENRNELFLGSRGDKIKERTIQSLLTNTCKKIGISNVGLRDIARIQAQYLLSNDIQIAAIEQMTGLSRNSISKLAPNLESNQLNNIHIKAYRIFDELIEFHPLRPAETFDAYFE